MLCWKWLWKLTLSGNIDLVAWRLHQVYFSQSPIVFEMEPYFVYFNFVLFASPDLLVSKQHRLSFWCLLYRCNHVFQEQPLENFFLLIWDSFRRLNHDMTMVAFMQEVHLNSRQLREVYLIAWCYMSSCLCLFLSLCLQNRVQML